MDRRPHLYFWEHKPDKFNYVSRRGYRDIIRREGKYIQYLVWNNPVATLDTANNKLCVKDCGWRTWLTKDRLNCILRLIDFEISSYNGVWRIFDRVSRKEFKWAGEHTIWLDDRKISPAVPVRRNIKLSIIMERFHEKAVKALKSNILVDKKGKALYCLIIDKHPRRLYFSTLLIKAIPDTLKLYMWEGVLPFSTVERAFMNSDIKGILKALKRYYYTLEKCSLNDLLERINDYRFSSDACLPAELERVLAVSQVVNI
ncbi:MAG: hypothetical protein NWF09_07670 [Candidatus Bathyarchaeota archaeon]|nr:hypothetical protein [Candidatus Bathyarchaeota archaeon]